MNSRLEKNKKITHEIDSEKRKKTTKIIVKIISIILVNIRNLQFKIIKKANEFHNKKSCRSHQLLRSFDINQGRTSFPTLMNYIKIYLSIQYRNNK